MVSRAKALSEICTWVAFIGMFGGIFVPLMLAIEGTWVVGWRTFFLLFWSGVGVCLSFLITSTILGLLAEILEELRWIRLEASGEGSEAARPPNSGGQRHFDLKAEARFTPAKKSSRAGEAQRDGLGGFNQCVQKPEE